MIWVFYNLIFPVAMLCMLPKFLVRMARRGGYRRHFEQRFGKYGSGVRTRLSEGERIWIHAVSVGEINVALRFIEAYRKNDNNALFVLSTNTSTAHAIGSSKLDKRDVLIYFPVDFPFVINRVLNTINPKKLVLVEGEFWPNLIRLSHKRGVQVSLINGRMSDSSFKGYMKLKPLTQQVLRMIDPICVQGNQDKERMISMGADPSSVHVAGTAKYDLPLPDEEISNIARGVLRNISVPDSAKIIIGGSTWPGEEDALCEIYKKMRKEVKNLFLILVPRHVERSDEVIQSVEEVGLTYTLRSEVEAQPTQSPDVLIVNTTGEILSFYSVSDIVFVGKSLTQHGGQNPIEPALFAKPIVVGPHMENFPVVVDDFLNASAIVQVGGSDELELEIRKLLFNDKVGVKVGQNAFNLVKSQRGATERMVRFLL